MQTFLPYADFAKVAKTLDSKRLNKQILECYQVLNVLSNDDPKAGWRNHPAVKMWRGHEHGLYKYAMAMVSEANLRSIKTDKNVENLRNVRSRAGNRWGNAMPSWYYNQDLMKRITTTHKANLFKKQPEAYPQFISALDSEYNEPCCDKCQYFWVTHVKEINE